jgi:hypothetical protein
MHGQTLKPGPPTVLFAVRARGAGGMRRRLADENWVGEQRVRNHPILPLLRVLTTYWTMCGTWTWHSEPPWSTPRLSSASRRQHSFPGSHSPWSCCRSLPTRFPLELSLSNYTLIYPGSGSVLLLSFLALPISHHSTPDANDPPSGAGNGPNSATALRPPYLSPLYSALVTPLQVLPVLMPRSCACTCIALLISHLALLTALLLLSHHRIDLAPALVSSRTPSATDAPSRFVAPAFVSLTHPVSHPTYLDIAPLPSLALALTLASSARRSTRRNLSARGADSCLGSRSLSPLRRLKPESIRRRALELRQRWTETSHERASEQGSK